MDVITRFPIPGIAFILTVVLGIWLGSAGKPYNGILFNVHKLLALGAVVAAGVQVAGLLRAASTPLPLPIILLAVAALSVVALFASGALMSADKLDYAPMRAGLIWPDGSWAFPSVLVVPGCLMEGGIWT
jgi:hypothetical protein